jgi:two-component system alkaline phosphatase synthesis response regulator PhoP
MSAKILIIDDEPDIRILIKYTLEKEGFIVDTAENGEEGIEKAQHFLPDLIILDVMMPGIDGMETCEKLRQNSLFDNTFICFLTARSEDYSQIAGFESGGDDYISKPVKPKVLVSRINGILRRKSKSTDKQKELPLSTSGLIIDRDKFLVFIDGKELNFPKKEFKLLVLLADKNGDVCTRESILNIVWGEDVVVGDRTIDVHIRKLRGKIGDEKIKTVKGIGYRFIE